MNAADWIVISVLALCAAAAIFCIKKGGVGCGSCRNCDICKKCKNKDKKR